MLLVGACRHPNRPEAAVAVAESTLRQGKKRYIVRRVEELLSNTPDAFIREIAQIAGGQGRREKRLFSQDRRPTKTVADPPRVVTRDDGSRVVEELRNRGIVVEAVRFDPGKPWKKTVVGRALGADYTVEPADVMACAGKVRAEGRIELPDQTADRRFGALDLKQAERIADVPATVLAAALLLWFRETVPYRRSYRAN